MRTKRIKSIMLVVAVIVGLCEIQAFAGVCVPSARPHHGRGMDFGSDTRYAFVGNRNRCPTVAAPQFLSGGVQLPNPNNNLPADAMASMMAQL